MAPASRYLLITLRDNEEEHRVISLEDALRPGDEFRVEHGGKVENVRVESVEPSGIDEIDARVSARVIKP